MLTSGTPKGSGDGNLDDPATDTEDNMMNNEKGPVRIEKDTLNNMEDVKQLEYATFRALNAAFFAPKLPPFYSSASSLAIWTVCRRRSSSSC